jgi:hypothetical protein
MYLVGIHLLSVPTSACAAIKRALPVAFAAVSIWQGIVALYPLLATNDERNQDPSLRMHKSCEDLDGHPIAPHVCIVCGLYVYGT